MSPAISPRCPSCGAPADPTRPLCRYCACRLATVACPECAALVSLDAHHCPRCGTALAVEAEGPSPFTCPEGHGPLERRALGDSVLHACPTCAGIWMEAAPFQALAEARELRQAALHLLPEPHQPGLRPTPVTYRPCLVCAKVMNRQNYARISGIVVDVCREHGFWFEPDELRRVLVFIEGGGLARARDREILRSQEAERAALQAQWLKDTGRAKGKAWDWDG